MNLAAIEVATYAACLVLALVFLGACLLLDARHSTWTLLLAVAFAVFALGFAFHVVLVQLDRAV